MSGSLAEAGRSSSDFHLRRAEELIEQRNAESAEEHLAKIAAGALDEADAARVEAVRAEIARMRAERARELENERGSVWFQFKLEDYEERYLGGDPELARVRLFLERCAEFRERWPEHPELDWVERQERRFANLVDLDDAPAWPDVEWKAKVLTNARPRDYKQAFELVEAFRETADARERVPLDAFLRQLEAERAQYHADQLQYARREYENGNADRAFEWLVQSIVGLGDEAMADEAAEFLVRFENADGLLRGYRKSREADFEILLENRVVREFARKHDIPAGP
jgi:hypothetical protein